MRRLPAGGVTGAALPPLGVGPALLSWGLDTTAPVSPRPASVSSRPALAGCPPAPGPPARGGRWR